MPSDKLYFVPIWFGKCLIILPREKLQILQQACNSLSTCSSLRNHWYPPFSCYIWYADGLKIIINRSINISGPYIGASLEMILMTSVSSSDHLENLAKRLFYSRQSQCITTCCCFSDFYSGGGYCIWDCSIAGMAHISWLRIARFETGCAIAIFPYTWAFTPLL